jgi:hypothetical protein
MDESVKPLFVPSKRHSECDLGRRLAILGFGSWYGLESSMNIVLLKYFPSFNILFNTIARTPFRHYCYLILKMIARTTILK